MDYLRTIGSAAVQTLVQKSGLNTPFSLGAKVSGFEGKSIWTLYDGLKRDDGTPVSVFEFDGSAPNKKNILPLAKNALRKLRTTRHPDVLKFMDAVETETAVHIMTERVTPLSIQVQLWSPKDIKEQEEWLLWGLHRLSTAVAFLNDSANATHGNIRLSSVFLSSTGEWKLGGFELLSSPVDSSAVLYVRGTLPNADSISSPEVKKGGWFSLKDNPTSALDSYGLALLIHSLFNPAAGPPPTTHPPHPPPQASSRGAIPTSVFPSFKKLLNPNPKARLNAKGFIDIGMAESAGEGSGFFKSNRLFKICESLGNFGLMSDGERRHLITMINDVAPTLPTAFATRLVLPSLLNCLSLPAMATQASAIIPLVVRIGKDLPSDDYAGLMLEPIIKLFASPDRGIRIALLDALSEFAPKLDKRMVSDKIWPNLQTGFSDTVALIREATVKSIGLLSDKFSDRILNNDLLRHLARLQSDPEPSIRTNTRILIGRLGPNLGYNSKRKVLIMAFAKALKDDFVHARVAGLMAFMACIDCFEIDELAGRVIGVVGGALVDKEKLVRDQAFKAIDLFMKKIEAHAAAMPETAETEDSSSPLGFVTANGQAALTSTAAGAAGALAGWAISSLGGKKLTANELQSSISPSGMTGAATAPPLPSASTKPTAPAVPSASKPKGMQLGANKLAKTSIPGSLVDEADSWGGDDLIDLNADEGDWTAFESAPSTQSVNAVGLSFHDFDEPSGSANGNEDPWGDMDDTAPAPQSPPSPSYPILSTTKHPKQPKPTKLPAAGSSRTSTLSTTSSSHSTSVSSPPIDHDIHSPPVSTAGMTREEKAAEMARRKEERRLRIAQLKEQKKGAAVK